MNPSGPGHIPFLAKNARDLELIVDGQPYIMLSGELHNSSSSSMPFMRPIWPKLVAMNLNSVIAVASWELIEPEEGKFDFTLVDGLLSGARAHNLRLVVIYFGAYKNADSSYAPAWVLSDLERFPRMEPTAGTPRISVSPLSTNLLAADSRAFAALMAHLREVDAQRTVIAIQVENETGLLGASRDHSALGEEAFGQQVPPRLMQYLADHTEDVHPILEDAWQTAGHRTSGTWLEVFGTLADEAFMAWSFGWYVGQVAAAGKKEYPLPMFANAWLLQPDYETPGKYPSGGPTFHMLDIWRAAAPALDLYAPDIYTRDFRTVTADYHRAGNPLFIPESNRIIGRAYYAFGEHHAICYAPFAIDSFGDRDAQRLGTAYKLLEGLAPLLTGPYESKGIMIYPEEEFQEFDLGDYRFHVTHARPWGSPPPPPESAALSDESDDFAGGLVIHLGSGRYLAAGSGFSISVQTNPAVGKQVNFRKIEEGVYQDGAWLPGRRLNGDEDHIVLRQPGELMFTVYAF